MDWYADCEATCVRIMPLNSMRYATEYRARNVAEYRRWHDQVLEPQQDSLYASSSLDWPLEYTSDPDVVAVCNFIRGNSVAIPNDQPFWRE